MDISRRAVLNGIGQGTALGSLAAALPAQLRAADAAPAAATPSYCITRIYRQAEGVTFNGDMFRDNHLPNMIKAYGNSADRIELRLPIPPAAPAAGAPPPPPQQIIATVNIWFRDIQGFLGKKKATDAELDASMKKVTSAQVMEQVDQVLASLGDDRATVPVDCVCLSSYFPAKEGGTMDTKYFAETFYPKFASTYGAEAIRRIEVTGAALPKSQVMGSTHVYIRDEAAYDAATQKAPAELFAELKPYTNIVPLQTLTKLHAFG